jgi:hypothetical protein
MTLPEMALRFILSNRDVVTVIPGMRRPAHVEANLAASDAGPLPPDLLGLLRQHRWDRRPASWTRAAWSRVRDWFGGLVGWRREPVPRGTFFGEGNVGGAPAARKAIVAWRSIPGKLWGAASLSRWSPGNRPCCASSAPRSGCATA